MQNMICMKCLTALKSFNEFYKEVAEAHNALTSNKFKIESPKIESTAILNIETVGKIVNNEVDKSLENEDENNVTESDLWLNEDDKYEIEILNVSNEWVDGKDRTNESSDENLKHEISDIEYSPKDNSEKISSDDDDEYIPEENIDDNNEEFQGTRTKRHAVISTKVLDGTQKKKNDTSRMEEEDEQIRAAIKMKCELCDSTFNVFRDCKAHYRIHHDMDGYLSCCNLKYFKRVRLVEHIQRHINPNGFKYVHYKFQML